MKLKRIITRIVFFLFAINIFGLPKGASIYQLNNGLEVLLIENRALPMVGVNVVIKTGSAYETYETSGMSHMLEHLLFNGTTTRTQRELYDDVDLIGGYNNANTGDYYTNFMMVAPAQHAEKAMEIQADMLFNSILPEEKFEKEKGIVLEEIAQSLAKPATQVEYDLAAELYQGHALSLPTLGTYATIEHMNRDDVYAYYRASYVPNNMIMSVIGNFDTAQILEVIKKTYGNAAPGTVDRPISEDLKMGFSLPEKQPAQNLFKERFYGGEVPIMHLIYELPAQKPQSFYTLLETAMDEKAADLKSQLKQLYPDCIENSEINIQASPISAQLIVKLNLAKTGPVESIRADVSKWLQGVRVKIPESTLASMVTKSKTDFLRNIEKPHMFGIYNAYDFSVSGIDAVMKLADLQELQNRAKGMKKFRVKSQPRVLMHYPIQVNDAAEITAVTTELIQTEDKGMTLIARQNPNSDLLAIHYLFKHKKSYEDQFGKDAAKVLHDCFGQRMKSEEKLAESQKYGLKFTVNDNPWIPMDNIYLHPDFGYIRVEGLAEGFEGAVQFLNTEMNGFVPTLEEYEKATSEMGHGGMMAGHKNAAKDLFAALKDSVLYGKESSETTQKPLTYESLLKFTRVYFPSQNRIVSVVSPRGLNDVKKAFLQGVSPQKAESFPLSDPAYQSPGAEISVETSGGGEQAYLFWGYISEISEPDKAALQALSLVLSDRISFDIREKQGLAYRMSSGVSTQGEKALFYINLGSRPENVEVLKPQFESLLSLEVLAELNEEEVQKSINMYLGRMMFRRLSSINQAYYLGTSQFFHGDLDHDSKFLEDLAKVKMEDVQRVAETYMIPHNPISIIVN